jgi:hypothetical protein
LLKKVEPIDPQNLSDFQELDDIEPSFGSLKLRDVGLGPTQSLRKHSLCNASIFPRFDEKRRDANKPQGPCVYGA